MVIVRLAASSHCLGKHCFERGKREVTSPNKGKPFQPLYPHDSLTSVHIGINGDVVSFLDVHCGFPCFFVTCQFFCVSWFFAHKDLQGIQNLLFCLCYLMNSNFIFSRLQTGKLQVFFLFIAIYFYIFKHWCICGYLSLGRAEDNFCSWDPLTTSNLTRFAASTSTPGTILIAHKYLSYIPSSC